jgi:hypothetical protein
MKIIGRCAKCGAADVLIWKRQRRCMDCHREDNRQWKLAHSEPRLPREVRDADRFWSRVNKDGRIVREELGPCWEWTSRLHYLGYGRISYRGRDRFAHRVAWILTFGEPTPGLDLLHKCDNRKCVNPSHLYLGTHEQNMRDKAERGNQERGVDHPAAKLTEQDVMDIRTSQDSNDVLARCYGINGGTVSRIRSGKTWRHLPMVARKEWANVR